MQAAPTQVPAQQPPASSSSGSRILFLVVVSGADLDCLEEPRPAGPRYTRDALRSLLLLLGCKPRLAYKISSGVFAAVEAAVASARGARGCRRTTFQVHPHRNGKLWVSLTRGDFMGLVSGCAAQYAYKISPSSDELKVACSLRERRRCVVVLLCGTSGSGKSTLASILANRLGITTVISTDSIRHMLRSFSPREASPLLWASTYQAGEFVQPGEGKAGKACSEGERTLAGYKAQCELLAEQLELLVAGCEARQQSLICEGVHLHISFVKKLMGRHPDVLPFLVHIASEGKHVERMAVRAKYMTLDPHKNRYVRYMGSIRLIQEYLVRKADKHGLPRVENSNVDRSVAIIHLTVMGCLRRMARGEPVLDPATGTARLLTTEYAAVLEHLQGEKERAAVVTAAARASNTGQVSSLAAGDDAVDSNRGTAGSSSGSSSQHGAAAAADDAPGEVELLPWSPEGPLLRWDRLLQSSRLSPGDDGQPGSPVSPLAAAGLALRYPRHCSSLRPDGQDAEGGAHTSAAAAAEDEGHSSGSSGAAADRARAGSSSHAGAELGRDDGWQDAAAAHRRRQQPEDDLGVSSGEELDELGELGSSDNEGERFLQDYGSMNESTTCDEHDDEEHELLGLRAWNAGMARALWPSYSHVYNAGQPQPAAAAPAAAGGVMSPGSSRGADATAGGSQHMARAQSAGAAAAAAAGAGLGAAGWLGPGQPQQPQLRSRPWSGGSSIASSSRGYRRSAAALARSSSGRRRWSGSGSHEAGAAAVHALRSAAGSPASPGSQMPAMQQQQQQQQEGEQTQQQ
ncbi:hypothetical protein OEZ85_000930 [Tetradesmus obliquus]|uniref:Zeta toxin domain-containing protein n=1 Tax=Tetradesmus obliquus TaxID=3088 RepID=A0ABY8UN20_TETOB|nr:hypothetical protein OEZ85_000930 [Tetradesmus obliquus]